MTCKFAVSIDGDQRCGLVQAVICGGMDEDQDDCPFWNKALDSTLISILDLLEERLGH